MPADYVVNASSDENGHISGGQPGDQTGREVRVQLWYDRPWDLMLRYPNATLGQQASVVAAQLANSNLVGYNQARRNTLYQQLKAHGWDVNAYIASGIKTEVDCSSFVFACWAYVLPAIRYDGDAPSTSEMPTVYPSWGFTPYTNSMYLDSPTYLQPGDLLVYTGHHTVIAYDGGVGPLPPHPGDLIIAKKEIVATKDADSFDKMIAGRYQAATDLYLRNGPGVLNKALTVIPEGSTVYNYGYYTTKLGRVWLYIQFKKDDILYTGFASSKYLYKIK